MQATDIVFVLLSNSSQRMGFGEVDAVHRYCTARSASLYRFWSKSYPCSIFKHVDAHAANWQLCAAPNTLLGSHRPRRHDLPATPARPSFHVFLHSRAARPAARKQSKIDAPRHDRVDWIFCSRINMDAKWDKSPGTPRRNSAST